MKARAIIELDEMPINCFKRSVRVGCKPICPLEYLCRHPKQQHRYSNEFQDDCPLREVPGWTEIKQSVLKQLLAELDTYCDEESGINIYKEIVIDICHLAGVEV